MTGPGHPGPLPPPGSGPAAAPASRLRPGAAAPGAGLAASLQGRLLAWTLGALLLLWLSLVAAGYRSGLHETEEMVDGELASVAALVLASPGWQLANGPPADAVRQHDYQQDFTVVVWDGQGRLLAHHGTAPLPPPQAAAADGFATLLLGEPPGQWRSFTRGAAGPGGPHRVMVLVNAGARNELGWDIASQVAAPTLWLLPVLALVLGLAIALGLQPLRRLSDAVRALDVRDPGRMPSAPWPREFKPIVEAVDHLVDRGHAALQRERALAGELAHELRTPLAALVLQARSLREQARAGGAAPGPDALARLEQDALRAGQVLDELLALARADHTALTETAQPVDLALLAARLLADAAPQAMAAGHELALAGDATLPLRGHPLLLELALRNLVDNALVHAGRPTLVELQVDAEGRRLLVCNGPLGAGLEPSAQGTAIATAADETRPPPAALGLGLGLGHRLVAKVAAIHGARFQALPPPAGFSHCYALLLADASAG